MRYKKMPLKEIETLIDKFYEAVEILSEKQFIEIQKVYNYYLELRKRKLFRGLINKKVPIEKFLEVNFYEFQYDHKKKQCLINGEYYWWLSDEDIWMGLSTLIPFTKLYRIFNWPQFGEKFTRFFRTYDLSYKKYPLADVQEIQSKIRFLEDKVELSDGLADKILKIEKFIEKVNKI